MTEPKPLPPSGDESEPLPSEPGTALPPGHRDQGREVPGANHEGYAEAKMVDDPASPQDVSGGEAPDEDSALQSEDDGITTLPPAPGFTD